MHRSSLRHISVESYTPSALAHHANYEWSSLRPLLPEHYLSELGGLRDREDLVGALIDNELAWRARMNGTVEACDIWRRLGDLKLRYAGRGREAEPTLIFGRYRRVRLLGQGGCGSVWLVQDENTGIDVALKRLHAPAIAVSEDPETTRAQATFARESQALRQLAGLPVAHLLDLFWAPLDEGPLQVPILVQAFVPGPTLADFLAVANQSYALGDCLRVIIEVAEVLRLVHNRDRIHRDIKPSNIGFDSRGLPVLIDFGISSGLTKDAETTTTHGATPAYAPPEWIKGDGSCNVTGEVYCLASTLYHLLTRQLPYPHAPSLVEQYFMKVKGPPACPSTIRADVPAELDRMLMRALAPLPEDRYQSITEFADQLQEVRANIDRDNRPTGPDVPVIIATPSGPLADQGVEGGRGRRRLLMFAFLGVLVVGLVLLVVGLLKLPPRQPIAPDEVTLAISSHLARQKPVDAAACRFLRLDHRHNDPAVRSEELVEVRQGVRDLLEHLAGRAVDVPELPDIQSTVLVLDLRPLGWKSGHWDMLVDSYPYGVYQGNLPPNVSLNRAAREQHRLTNTMVAAVRADWFLAAVTSPPLEPSFAKMARREPAADWPPLALRVRDRYSEQRLTLDQMAREVGTDSGRLRAAIQAGDVGELGMFRSVLDGGMLDRREWEGDRQDLRPPFFAAIEACKTGEAIRPPPQ